MQYSRRGYSGKLAAHKKPDFGRCNVSRAEGEIIIDEYDIPIQIDAPLGQYMLEIGMYQLETGQRLEVRGGPEGEGDRILLGKVVEVLD